jgi:hypothetical protein
LHVLSQGIFAGWLENLESYKYLGSMLTNDGRCTCEIKSRIATAKAAKQEESSFY